MNVHIVVLNYKIRFDDSDDGRCYAGDGQKILRAYFSKEEAERLTSKWNPIFRAANREPEIFPVQPNNRRIKKEFGFTLDTIDDGYDFHLAHAELVVMEPNTPSHTSVLSGVLSGEEE